MTHHATDLGAARPDTDFQAFYWKPIGEATRLYETFHESTKLRRHRFRRVLHDPAEGGPKLRPTRSKRHAGRPRVELPLPEFDGAPSFRDVLESRRTYLGFGGEALTRQQLANLLHAAAGLTAHFVDGDWDARAAPSAGARYPIEVYPVVLRAEGIEPGVYHYHVETRSLELLQARDPTNELADAFLGASKLAEASVVLVLTGVFERTVVKYGERGYRLVLLDAGHVGENVYLAAEAMGLGASGLGGFLDDELHRMLHVDGLEEAALYALAVGTRKRRG